MLRGLTPIDLRNTESHCEIGPILSPSHVGRTCSPLGYVTESPLRSPCFASEHENNNNPQHGKSLAVIQTTMAPSHPLRRVSTGSLNSLARSTDRPQSNAGLDVLAPALQDLADEVAALSTNTQRMSALHDALGQFNEGFAAYMYALKMNAFCVEWPQAPNDSTLARLQQLGGQLAPDPEPTPSPPRPQEAPQPQHEDDENAAADMTYATAYSPEPKSRSAPTRRVPPPRAPGAGVVAKKKPAGPGLAERKAAAAAKKKREIKISKLIDSSLPLEYRGANRDNRITMEGVIERLMVDYERDGDGLASKYIAHQWKATSCA